MADWFYTNKGSRIGPTSEQNMRTLVQQGKVDRSTLCWTQAFGGEWKPLDQTQLWNSALVAHSGPPPLPATAISNFWAYAFAVVPIISGIIDAVVSETTPTNGQSAPVRFFWIGFLLYIIATTFDARVIRKSGNGRVAPAVWFWIAPVYLWKRARILRQRPAYFWVWIVAFLGSIAFDQPEIRGQLYLGAGMPPCSGAFATQNLKKIFDDIPLNKISGNRFVGLSDVIESGSADKLRQCHAIVQGSNTKSRGVRYSIQSRDTGDFYFEVNLD